MDKQPCPYCKNLVPDSGVFGLPTYTDIPENHKKDCPLREIMEISIANDIVIDKSKSIKKIVDVLREWDFILSNNYGYKREPKLAHVHEKMAKAILRVICEVKKDEN